MRGMRGMLMPPASASIIYLVTAVVTSLLGLAAVSLMANLLDPAQYGRIGVFLSLLGLSVPLVSLGADGLIAVNKTALDAEEYEVYRRTAIGIALLSFGAMQTLTLLAWLIGTMTDPILLLLPSFALLRFISVMATTEFVSERKAVVYATVTIANSVAALALTWLLLSQIVESAFGRILALMVAEALLMMARYHGRMHLLVPRLDLRFRKEIYSFGLPVLVSLIGAWGLNEADKLLVTHEFGLIIAGQYAAAAALAAVMTSVNQSLTYALFPNLFDKLRSRSHSLPALMLRYCLMFVGLNAMFATGVILAYLVVNDTLLPPTYALSSIFFYSLVVASLAVAFYRPFSLIAQYLQLNKARAIAVIIGGAVTVSVAGIGMQIMQTPVMAAVGIVAGYMIAGVLLCIMILAHEWREAASRSDTCLGLPKVQPVSKQVSLTIITSTFNCCEALARTAASIRAQGTPTPQWIIADGGSTDGTLDVIRANEDIVFHWSSEPDKGIYDAWNKACGSISGDWVLFLGAGDLLDAPTTLSRVAERLAGVVNTNLAYGGVTMIDAGGRELQRQGKISVGKWQRGRPALPCHQGVFHHASLLQELPPFDASFRICGDAKIMLKAISVALPFYLALDVAKMEVGGISTSVKGWEIMVREDKRIRDDLDLKLPLAQRPALLRLYAKIALGKFLGHRAGRLVNAYRRITGRRPIY
ncbi:MAG: O-antigen/teichoic acid export membrane protein [Loktanella salsilacus]|jgi:O-antigen/teichoic acid export membrane protein